MNRRVRNTETENKVGLDAYIERIRSKLPIYQDKSTKVDERIASDRESGLRGSMPKKKKRKMLPQLKKLYPKGKENASTYYGNKE